MPAETDIGPIDLTIASDPMAVRTALLTLFSSSSLVRLPDGERATAEIVLAEILNNVVEHAYATDAGQIEISIRAMGRALVCTIIDQGLQMPADMTTVAPTAMSPRTQDLPEGGFGWHLIRSLAHDLDYRRIGNRNELSFRLERYQ